MNKNKREYPFRPDFPVLTEIAILTRAVPVLQKDMPGAAYFYKSSCPDVFLQELK